MEDSVSSLSSILPSSILIPFQALRALLGQSPRAAALFVYERLLPDCGTNLNQSLGFTA